MTRRIDPKSKDGFSVRARGETEKQVIHDLKQLAFQDGVEISDLVFEGILIMFKAHHWPPGNPQLTLETYHIKPSKPSLCGYANCKNTAAATGTYLPTKKELNLCCFHFDIAKNSPKVWSNLSLTAKRRTKT